MANGLRRGWPIGPATCGAIPEVDITEEAGARMAVRVLRAIFDDDLGPRLPELLAPLPGQQTPLGILQAVMHYIIQANDRVTEDDIAAALEAVAPDLGGGDMPTLAEQWVEGRAKGHAEGHAEGRAKGRVRGRAEGLHEAIGDALEARFGVEALGLMDDVRKVDDAQVLRGMLRAVWSAETLDEAQGAVRGA